MNRHYTKYIISLLLFGTNGLVASFIFLPSMHIVFWRTLIGFIMLMLFFVLLKQTSQIFTSKKQAIYIGLSGVALGLSWIFLFEAYNLSGVSIATLAYYCGPALMLVLSPILFKETLTPQKIIGFLFVIVGMVFVNHLGLNSERSITGLFYGLTAALFYFFMVVFTKKSTSQNGLENSMIQLGVSFLTVFVYCLVLQDIPPLSSTVEYILPITLLGLLNTGIGCYLYFSSISKLPVQSVSILGYIDPVSALLFAVLFLNEQLSSLQLFGVVFILGGMIYANFTTKIRKK